MFFFNDTATTEIYTYGHTLSLHTLFRSLDSVGVKVTIVDINPSSFELARRYFGLPDQVPCHVADGKKFLDSNEHRYDRSEEHTSEFQSLIRISYAVFCLKKKHTTSICQSLVRA